MNNLDKLFSNLLSQIEDLRDELDDAKGRYNEVKARLTALESFRLGTERITEITVVNSEGGLGSNSIVTCWYKIQGLVYLLMATEFDAGDYTCFVGHVMDIAEKTPLYSCDFYPGDEYEKEDLFNLIIANYAQWRFDI